jgi:hypothetical protein
MSLMKQVKELCKFLSTGALEAVVLEAEECGEAEGQTIKVVKEEINNRKKQGYQETYNF